MINILQSSTKVKRSLVENAYFQITRTGKNPGKLAFGLNQLLFATSESIETIVAVRHGKV